MAGKFKGTCLVFGSLGALSGFLQFLGYFFLPSFLGEIGTSYLFQGGLYGFIAGIMAVFALFMNAKLDWEESLYQSSFFYIILILGVSLFFISSFIGIRTIVLFLL
ncbi:MAG: hypothetical protein ACFFDI_17655 [Promethearchaeota archaeon]